MYRKIEFVTASNVDISLKENDFFKLPLNGFNISPSPAQNLTGSPGNKFFK